MAAVAVSLRKSHDIVISSFCNIVKGQANYAIENLNSVNLLRTCGPYGFEIFFGYFTSLFKDLRFHISLSRLKFEYD